MFSRMLRLCKKTMFVIRYQGFKVAWNKATRRLSQKMSIMRMESSLTAQAVESLFSMPAQINAQALLHTRWPDLQPIANLVTVRARIRLNLILDNVTESSLLGIAAYPLILASLLAGRNDYDLRIISRNSVCNPTNVIEYLEFFEIIRPKNIEFFSACQRNQSARDLQLDVSEQDVFMATSWQSAYVADQTNRRERFFYIVQDDETLYASTADERVLCKKIWANEKIDFLFTSQQIWDYFCQTNNKTNLLNNGCWFEQRLSRRVLSPGEFNLSQKKKYVLLFDGRPGPSRNLLFSALEYLDDAITAGIIDGDYWQVIVFGADIPAFVFSNGLKPTFKQHLTWPEYLEFARTVDLVFCLVEESYPDCSATDLVYAGTVVLTGYSLKAAAGVESANIIRAKLHHSSMLAGFREAIDLVQSPERRKSNCDTLARELEWNSTLIAALDFMSNRLKENKHV